MIYSYVIEGLTVCTGDIICTADGSGPGLLDHVWRIAGRLIPGAVDHVAMYVGPGGLCVESGPAGVVGYEVPGDRWDPEAMKPARGHLTDRLYGVAYPLAGRGLSVTEEQAIRRAVADYCLAQAASGKPYNLNFLNPETEDAFYCSQLVYRAYLQHGIDLNECLSPSLARMPDCIVLPHEIWSACAHRQPGCPPWEPGPAAERDV